MRDVFERTWQQNRHITLALKTAVQERKVQRVIESTFKVGKPNFDVCDIYMSASRIQKAMDQLVYIIRTRKIDRPIEVQNVLNEFHRRHVDGYEVSQFKVESLNLTLKTNMPMKGKMHIGHRNLVF